MRPATIVGGALGGILVAGLLAPSMYLDVPRSLISDWTTAPRTAGLISTLLAAVSLGLIGMWGGATSPGQQARGGALAGWVAACVALTVVLPGTGVMAHGDLIGLVEGGRATADGLTRAIVRSVVLTPGYQTLGATVMLGAGLLLGWLGGVVHDLWRGEPTRVAPTLRPSPVVWLGLLGSVVAIPMQLGATIAVETLVFQELRAMPTWVGQAQLTAPLALGGGMVAVLCAFITRDAVVVFRKGQRVRGLVWMAAMSSLLLVLAAISVPVYWRVLILPGGVLGCLFVALAPLVGAIVGWRSQVDLERDPRIFQDVVGEAVLTAVLVSTQLAVHGGSSSLVVGMLSLPYRELVLNGDSKVDTAPLGDAIHTLFLAHLSLPAIGMALVLGYLVIALPVWFVTRLVKG